ncbi:MAG: hypothetical protein DCC58_14805 [Chloroflexi bacterium]|nr:MAG: hypothetical protein DCC58_14805 [Chloroflexota bacterium]
MSFRATPRAADESATVHRIGQLAESPVVLPSARRNDPLLVTKLAPPPLRRGSVSRPELLARLDAGMAGRLTLISAPAGYGKSTLLSAWASGCDLPVGWVALDAGDSDPVRFWRYVIAALGARSPEVSARTGDVPAVVGDAPLEPAVAALINALAGSTNRVVLVLDDYHLVASEAVQRGVAFLIDYAPPQLHVVVSAREDPPLPLSRWRAQGSLTELRAAELRFSTAEAEQLLRGVLRAPLPPEQVAALEERTEGWAAGLHLAALALRDRAEPSRFVEAFSGSHRSVVDYLADEVLAQFPADVQAFLVETSLLDRLNGPLCDAVTGRAGSQTLLEQLERANVFLVPLDDERRWFRYHHLLSDVLREQRYTTAWLPVTGNASPRSSGAVVG